MKELENNRLYFLVKDESIKNLPDPCEFYDWLKSEGFISGWEAGMSYDKGFYQGYVDWIYVNLNTKIVVPGMLGIDLFKPIGNHAITIEEFKTIYEIYKKYTGKKVLEF